MISPAKWKLFCSAPNVIFNDTFVTNMIITLYWLYAVPVDREYEVCCEIKENYWLNIDTVLWWVARICVKKQNRCFWSKYHIPVAQHKTGNSIANTLELPQSRSKLLIQQLILICSNMTCLSHEQNGHHLVDIFLKGKFCISVKISVKFVP